DRLICFRIDSHPGQQRRQERYQRWLQRLEQQEQDPNRQPTNYHPRITIPDEREQSQQIRDMQAFDEERQQEFNRIHNWDQRRLLDYQENRNTLVDEPNDDDQQQITSNRYA
ncbi:unnamed protein product, partial [Rotaria socialis]